MNHGTETISYFSSRGPSAFDGELGPDVTAPGENIRSSIPGGAYQGWGYSGTSMAGPHVSGLVALMWAADEQLKGNVVETARIIRETAKGKTSNQTCGNVPGTQVPNNTFGYGIVRAYEAVAKVIELKKLRVQQQKRAPAEDF